MSPNTEDLLDDITLVSRPAAQHLNDKQAAVYRDHRGKLARWALTMDKNPQKAQGYAHETVKRRLYRLDKFYRHVWTQLGRFTVDIRPEHADQWMREIAMEGNTESYNAQCQKAVKMLFKWQEFAHAQPVNWEPDIKFSSSTSGKNPKHYFGVETLKKLAEAALEIDSLPSYTGVTPEKRSEINAYLAQRFGKPKREVGPDDWERANSWKVPALIHITIDAGLRNKEVRNAKVSWIDWDENARRIPEEDAVKSDDSWTAALRSQTMLILERWVEEREMYEKYADRDELFLTRYGIRMMCRG